MPEADRKAPRSTKGTTKHKGHHEAQRAPERKDTTKHQGHTPESRLVTGMAATLDYVGKVVKRRTKPEAGQTSEWQYDASRAKVSDALSNWMGLVNCRGRAVRHHTAPHWSTG